MKTDHFASMCKQTVPINGKAASQHSLMEPTGKELVVF